MNADLLVIGVNYGTDDMAERFARSVRALERSERARVVIVDNTEQRDPLALRRRLATIDPPVEHLQTPANLGYFGAANYGLARCAAGGLPQWVILCNVDVEFRDPTLLSTLLRRAPADDVGVLAPRIWSNHSLRDLNPAMVRRPHRSRMHFYRIVSSNVYSLNAYEVLAAVKYGIQRRWRRIRHAWPWPRRRPRPSGRRDIYAPHGSCMALHRRFFERGGTLELPVFMFGEEIYVAEAARRVGLRIVYDPELAVWHDEHASTRLPRSRQMARYVAQAAKDVAERYFS